MRAVGSERSLTAIISLMLSEARCWHYAKGTSLGTAIISGVWRLSVVAICVPNSVISVLLIRSPLRLADKLVLVLW